MLANLRDLFLSIPDFFLDVWCELTDHKWELIPDKKPEHPRDDEGTQKKIKALAKAGNDIRDRGAYIDAIRGHLYAFITSDKQLVGSGAANRLNSEFKTKVILE